MSVQNLPVIIASRRGLHAHTRRLVDALGGLRGLLREDGSLLLFITKRNWLMRPLIGRWWEANLYAARELEDSFRCAGFSAVAFRAFPLAFSYLALWGHIVEARH